MEDKNINLYEALETYSHSGIYPMHMPGHKRNKSMFKQMNPYAIDITEIEGFDNLHDARGILKRGMKRAASLYGSEDSFYLINGSTVGLLAGIAACTKKKDKILVARNCHKAVYHAIYLNELKPIYVYPQIDVDFGMNCGIMSDELEELLIKHTDIKLIVITSPTYEGFLSDISGIAKIAHQNNIPLLVDEAHGAHLGFHKEYPEGSIKKGADLVVHSLHKTLPALTQSSLLHRNGNLVDKDILERYLSMYQSSSPSYVLMAGIEECVRILREKKEDYFEAYYNKLSRFYEEVKNLRHIRIYNKGKKEWFDPSKLIISVRGTNLSGQELYELLLSKYYIQMEMVSKDYVLGITSICDTQEGFDRLLKALFEIDANIIRKVIAKEKETALSKLRMAMTSYEAYNREYKTVSIDQSAGLISREYLYLYPPGIPILVPGEIISKELIAKIKTYQRTGLTLCGLADEAEKSIQVIL